ncbi:hypothetical protein [Phenylobacterium sp.]|uniref:hypothetical protein n=1 Tax=Phenylobacterium sp. TaxID=1871053 RepID=UPI003BAB9130
MSPARKGRKRCRLHGGNSLQGREHGRFRTGLWTQELREARALLRTVRAAVRDLYE